MSSFTFRPNARRRRAQVNLTSLIDVLFLLLIFFMLTSTFRQAGELELQLPSSTTASPANSSGERPTEVVLRADGSVAIDGQPMEASQLAARLRDLAQGAAVPKVLLNAESSARHADVVRVLDLVREAGFAGVSIGTEVPLVRQEDGN